MHMAQNNGHMPEKLDFITPTFLKILYLFHEDPINELHEREIVRRTKVSKGSANKILKELSRLSILERNEKGRMVFYRLNLKNAVARQLKVLFNVYSLSSLVKSIEQDSRRIILFGSCSEGVDTEKSDIDVFILTSQKRDVESVVNSFRKSVGRKLSCLIVNPNEFTKLKREDRPLYERIMSGIVLWESE
jgi:predicted nucleotidyltransferase